MWQQFVGEAVTRYWYGKLGRNETDVVMNVTTNFFPYPPYTKDPIIMVLHEVLPFLLGLSFILTVIVNVKRLVQEKEKRLKVL